MTNMSQQLIDVPGASLRYRLVGEPSTLPLLVFENGWGASFEQWAWVERALAPQTRLLFYDRAGIGGSTLRAPQTLAGLSAGLADLLAALKIESPVVVVGHSYGGLMVSLHAAQRPQMLRALVQLDATPDRDDPVLDPQLKAVKQLIGPASILLARIGVPNPVFGILGRMLPSPAGEALVRLSFGSVSSLKAAMAEMQLLGEIRAAIAAQPIRCPALIISAGRASEIKGILSHLVPRSKAQALVERMQSHHRAKAAQAVPGSWEVLPHNHGELASGEAGAADSTARLMAFVRSLR